MGECFNVLSDRSDLSDSTQVFYHIEAFCPCLDIHYFEYSHHRAHEYDGPLWSSRVMPQLVGIYPTIVIVIVALEKSFVEGTLSDSRLSAFIASRPATRAAPNSSGNVRLTAFAERAVRSTGDIETDAQYHAEGLGSSGMYIVVEAESAGRSGKMLYTERGSQPSATGDDVEPLRSVYIELQRMSPAV